MYLTSSIVKEDDVGLLSADTDGFFGGGATTVDDGRPFSSFPEFGR